MHQLEEDPQGSRERRFELALETIEATRKRRDEWRRVSLCWCAVGSAFIVTTDLNWQLWPTCVLLGAWFILTAVLDWDQTRRDRAWDEVWMNAKVGS